MSHALCLFLVHDADVRCYDIAVKLKSKGLQKSDLVDAVLLKLRTSAATAKAVKLAHFLQSPTMSAATAELAHLFQPLVATQGDMVMSTAMPELAHLLEPLAEALKKLAMSTKITHLLMIEVAMGG